MLRRETADHLVAREPHRRAAIAALAAGRGVAVLGRAGTGRTAFARALAAALPADRYAVSWVTATASIAGGLAAALGEPAGTPGSSLVAGLRSRARDRVPVLVVDDAHELGDADAALLLRLPARVRLIVTARTGQAGGAALRALVKDHLSACTLDGFDRDTTGRALAAMLDGEVAGPAADLLHRWTGGNPRLLAGLVEHGRRSGLLVRRAGLWWWHSRAGSPPCLPELFAEQLSGAGPADADVIAALSLGVPPTLDDAERLAPGAAERLEENGIVRPVTAACRTVLHWANPLLGAAFAGSVPATRRRRVATVLLAGKPGGDESDPVTYGRWRLAAPDTADPDALLRLAGRVRDADPQAAALLTGQVAELTGTAAAGLAHAAALLHLGEHDAVRRTLAACETGDPAERATAAVLRARLRWWAGPDPAGARDELTAVDGPGAAACDSVLLLLSGHTRPAGRRAAALLDSGGLTGDVVTEARAVQAAASALAGQAATGSAPAGAGPVDAVHAWARLWQDAAAVPAVFAEPLRAPLDGFARWLGGDADAAARRWREALGDPAPGPRPMRVETVAWLATCLAEQGRADEAAAVLAAGVPEGSGRVSGVLPGVTAAAWASVAAARGDLPAAGEHIEAAVSAAHDAGAALVELDHLIRAARLRGPAGPATVASRIRALLPVVHAPRLVLLGAATLALTRPDGVELLSFARRLAEAGLPGPACRLAEAASTLLAGAGDPRRTQARTLMAALRGPGGEPLPAGPDPLTLREAEVAGLAASGLTDREISDRLTVSVRTVESHLSRVYRKLGVSSRRALRVRVAH